MKIFGFEITRKADTGNLDEILSRLHAAYQTVSGVTVTPESCMQAPTVQAIVQAITRRISTLPLYVIQKSTKDGREIVERLPSHPVAKLLCAPNEWQTKVNYWMDATSQLVRYNNYFAWKKRGNTGPIRALLPLHPGGCKVVQDSNWNVKIRVNSDPGPATGYNDYEISEIHHVRGPARDTLNGDSPVTDCREAIAMEIAAEKYGAAFLGNGAMPFLILKFMQGVKGFKDEAAEKRFVEDFQQTYGGNKRFRAMALPVGLDISDPVQVDNDKAQFLDTRKYQRSVIAGAWGVPPHLVGDLERGTFNNVEQQSLDFVIGVVHPYVAMYESAMEADLLTIDDRNSGICIRFNLDAALRGDFKTRQEGLAIQRQWGIISANDWREKENMNPITDEDAGGDDYIRPLNYTVPGDIPDPATTTSQTPQDQNQAAADANAAASEKVLYLHLRQFKELLESVQS